jgi:hypothetical protein
VQPSHRPVKVREVTSPIHNHILGPQIHIWKALDLFSFPALQAESWQQETFLNFQQVQNTAHWHSSVCKHTLYSLCKARAKGEQLTRPKELSSCNVKESEFPPHYTVSSDSTPSQKCSLKKNPGEIHALLIQAHIKRSLLFIKWRNLKL